MSEKYKLTMIINDWNGETVFSKEFEGDAPYAQEFANFCHTAGIAYGYAEKTMNRFIPYDWDIER